MEDDEGEECRGLKLGLGLGRDYVPRPAAAARRKDKSLVRLDLSFTLFPNEEGSVVNSGGSTGFKSSSLSVDHEDEDCTNEKKNNGSPIVASMSATGAAASSVHGSRKKLRLTKEQSTLLEDIFKQHTILTPALKMALAEQLNLKPRQVEVWFQNRRARTKQKQTEVDCELLKKCCKSLSDENGRLKRELQELRRSLTAVTRSSPPPPALPSPPYVQHQKAAALTMCTSCEQKTTQGGSSSSSI